MNEEEREGKANVGHVFKYDRVCVCVLGGGSKDHCISHLGTRCRSVVNTVSCLQTEVTVPYGHGAAGASAGLDTVTRSSVTAHFGNIKPIIILQLPKALLP
jgi:hypothetical protein